MRLLEWWPENASLTFVYPWLLLFLLLIPLLAYLRGKRGRAAAVSFSSTASLKAIGKQNAARAGKFLRALLFLSVAILVVAMAQPRLGRSLTQIEASGIDIILVLDVSGSMQAQDFTIGGDRVSRLDAVREVTRKFIESRPNDRIGMIAFGTQPYVVSPMTLDHDWLLQNLDRVRIGLVEPATAIGSALAAAGNRLIEDKSAKSRVIVLMTDGDNNAGKIPPKAAAEALKTLHLKFYAIGVGTNGPDAFVWAHDQFGFAQKMPTPYDAESLEEITKIAEGRFFRATDTKSLSEIYRDIDKLEKTTVSIKKYQQYRELFPICLMSGAGLLVAQLLLSQTIWKKLP